MDFFNKIGERAKEFSDRAREATRRPTELLELTKLKYELTKLYRVLENNKEAIGELVFRQFKGEMGLESEIERLLQSTKKVETDILDLEKRIEELQPKPLICPRCEIELPPDGIYCYKCGIKVENNSEKDKENEDSSTENTADKSTEDK